EGRADGRLARGHEAAHPRQGLSRLPRLGDRQARGHDGPMGRAAALSLGALAGLLPPRTRRHHLPADISVRPYLPGGGGRRDRAAGSGTSTRTRAMRRMSPIGAAAMPKAFPALNYSSADRALNQPRRVQARAAEQGQGTKPKPMSSMASAQPAATG